MSGSRYMFIVASTMTVMLFGTTALASSSSSSTISFLLPDLPAVRELNTIRRDLMVTPEVVSGSIKPPDFGTLSGV